MARHFRLLVEDRGERFGCLLFRKVANWYCKVLRPGWEIQQRLVRIAGVEDFEAILQELHEPHRREGWKDRRTAETLVPVPRGPIEHW